MLTDGSGGSPLLRDACRISFTVVALRGATLRTPEATTAKLRPCVLALRGVHCRAVGRGDWSQARPYRSSRNPARRLAWQPKVRPWRRLPKPTTTTSVSGSLPRARPWVQSTLACDVCDPHARCLVCLHGGRRRPLSNRHPDPPVRRPCSCRVAPAGDVPLAPSSWVLSALVVPFLKWSRRIQGLAHERARGQRTCRPGACRHLQ